MCGAENNDTKAKCEASYEQDKNIRESLLGFKRKTQFKSYRLEKKQKPCK